VFGSRARDDYRPESDVDALVVSPDFEENETTNGRNRSTERGTTGSSRTRN
jgi:predicted nucleotidyltransferase